VHFTYFHRGSSRSRNFNGAGSLPARSGGKVMNAYTVNGHEVIAATPKEAIASYDKHFRQAASEPITCKLLHLGLDPLPPLRKVDRLGAAEIKRRAQLKGEALVGSAFSNRRRATANI